jgi:hypothetical protein
VCQGTHVFHEKEAREKRVVQPRRNRRVPFQDGWLITSQVIGAVNSHE